ncbi:hypothetical protein ABCS02_03275 [Microbacterium sp. X-17]|uniref:hypothetical protein n=1 Tax=Microbacterium sp. X-17 TaxID=3144404 RepID=UPI0031F5CACD
MEAVFASNGDVPQISTDAVQYWVRLWTPPTAGRSPWFVDEWQVSGAPDVLAVVDWAHKRTSAGGSFEVFVEHVDHELQSGSEVVPVKRHIRVYGAPAESGGVTEYVTFTANSEIADPESTADGRESP